ncbi:MAG: sigma-70 family RNA polymerase sigma factor [Flavobacteriales bacterium]|nr:sigma-70 family RNA polymerase sigma factor [Flavobacteriales bacterium]
MNALNFNRELIEFERSLKGFAYKFTRNDEDANDLVQETFLKALRYKDKFAEQTNLKAWLYTIMRNTFINNYRKASKANVLLDDSDENYFIDLSKQSKSETPDQAMAYKEIISEINALSDEYRVPFQMHYNGFKYKEIAEKLSLPIGTIKSRIFLARQKLSEQLADFRP